MHIKIRFKRFISIMLATTLALGAIFYTFASRQEVVFAGTNGAIHVTFSNGNGTDPAKEALIQDLRDRISEAETLLYETSVYEPGISDTSSGWWASQEAHNALRHAITTAQTVIENIGGMYFMPDDKFSITTSITGNTGFAAMIVRVYVP